MQGSELAARASGTFAVVEPVVQRGFARCRPGRTRQFAGRATLRLLAPQAIVLEKGQLTQSFEPEGFAYHTLTNGSENPLQPIAICGLLLPSGIDSITEFVYISLSERIMMFTHMNEAETAEAMQKATATLVARSAAGVGLSLIGGYRYRLLDSSPRVSSDIDYHCPGDLDAMRSRLVALFARELVPAVRRKFGYDGDARALDHPGMEAGDTRVVELAFYRPDGSGTRIVIPVEITRVVCMDGPVSRTTNGTVFLTTSDQDTIENKVVALLSRTFIQARDLVDVFLFSDRLGVDSPARVKEKLRRVSQSQASVCARLDDFRNSADYHAKNISAVMNEQLEPAARENIERGGGARNVLKRVADILEERLELRDMGEHEGA
jgi:hypothetical protein